MVTFTFFLFYINLYKMTQTYGVWKAELLHTFCQFIFANYYLRYTTVSLCNIFRPRQLLKMLECRLKLISTTNDKKKYENKIIFLNTKFYFTDTCVSLIKSMEELSSINQFYGSYKISENQNKNY